MSEQTRQALIDAKQIVVKCGTSSLTDESGILDCDAVESLCSQLNALMESGRSVTLIASGAIGAGMGELALSEKPTSLPMLQAVAAVGQGQLMRAFHDAMEKYGKRVGQVLVDRSDFENRGRYLNIRNTMLALHEKHVLPVINENDAVSVDEIRFGDNDIIAALITNMLSADLLILLTTVDGVMNGDRVISSIDDIAQAREYVSGDKSKLGSGGMGTKLTAADMVTSAGEMAVIASAKAKNILQRIVAGEDTGTIFRPSSEKLPSRKRWIGQAAKPAGSITIDNGAVTALISGGKSLLPSGITSVEGDFSVGDIISIRSTDQKEIARGLTNYDSKQLCEIMGKQSSDVKAILGSKPYDEAIHRNNMMLIQ